MAEGKSPSVKLPLVKPLAVKAKGISKEIDRDEMATLFVRVFGNANGEIVLDHLRQMTIERRLDPQMSEALMRHMEGQRFLTSYMEALVSRGREQ